MIFLFFMWIFSVNRWLGADSQKAMTCPTPHFQEAADMLELRNSFTLCHLCPYQVQTHSQPGQRCCDVPVLQTSSNSGGHQRLRRLQGQFLQRVFQVISPVGDATGAARTHPAYAQLQTQSKTRRKQAPCCHVRNVWFITAALKKSSFKKKK